MTSGRGMHAKASSPNPHYLSVSVTQYGLESSNSRRMEKRSPLAWVAARPCPESNVDSPQVVAPCGVSGQVHPAVSDEGGLTSVHASKPTKLTVSGTTIQGTPIQFHLSGMPNSLAGGSVRRVGTVPVNCISHKYRGSAHSSVSAHQYQVNMSAHQYRGSAHSRVSAHQYHGTKCQLSVSRVKIVSPSVSGSAHSSWQPVTAGGAQQPMAL